MSRLAWRGPLIYDQTIVAPPGDPSVQAAYNQFALTRQIGAEERALGVNLVDVLAGRAHAIDAIVRDVHGADVIAAAPALAGIEMSLVSELGCERFVRTRSNLSSLITTMS